jgi:hypothetical protein
LKKLTKAELLYLIVRKENELISESYDDIEFDYLERLHEVFMEVVNEKDE